MRKDNVIKGVLGEENVISPSDLCNHQFKRVAMGGYRPEEVDRLLERVADVMESLIVQVRELKRQNEEQRTRLDDYLMMEKSLQNALVSSQKLSENIIDSAKREADALLEQARLKKAETELGAPRNPRDLLRDVDTLTQQRARLREEMLALLEAHRRLLDGFIPAASVAVAAEAPRHAEDTEVDRVEETQPKALAETPVSRDTDSLPVDEPAGEGPHSLPVDEPSGEGRAHPAEIVARDFGALAEAAWAEAFPEMSRPSGGTPGLEEPQGEPASESSDETDESPQEPRGGGSIPSAVPFDEVSKPEQELKDTPDVGSEAAPEAVNDFAQESVESAEEFDRRAEAAWAQAFPRRVADSEDGQDPADKGR